MTEDDNPSVLAGLQPFEWSSERSVAYEVAIELIHQAMAYYTGLAEKERQGENRSERVEELTAARAAAAIQVDELDLFDTAEVTRVRDEYAALVQRLKQELGG